MAVRQLGCLSRCRTPGQKTRLPERSALFLWSILIAFVRARNQKSDHPCRFVQPLAPVMATSSIRLSTSQLWTKRKILALHTYDSSPLSAADRPNALFFAGDLGQRIFQQPFSWKALGVDIRGRSRTLRVNTGPRTRSACRPTAFRAEVVRCRW